MAEKLVKHIMHSGVIGCQPETSLAEVVRVLSDTDIHAIVVTNAGGEVVGIISHMDVIPHYGRDLADAKASDVMTNHVITVSPDTAVSDAIKIMVEKHIHRLVVAEPSDAGLQPAGIISTTDIVREMRGSKWSWQV